LEVPFFYGKLAADYYIANSFWRALSLFGWLVLMVGAGLF
jgi:hypothetical protein